MQATGTSPIDPSEEDKAICKAERNRRKKERRKQERRRKAEEAASLAEQCTSHKAGNTTPPSDKHHKSTVADRVAPRINKGSSKSARAHYSPVSSRFSLEHIDTLTAAPTTTVRDDDNSEQIVEEGHTTIRSKDPLTTGPLQSARSQPNLLHIDKLQPTNSSSRHSAVMVDQSELDSPDTFTFRQPSVPNPVDSDDDDSVEETITTQGAKATLCQASTALTPKRHLQALDLSVDQDDSDGEELGNLGDSDPRGLEPEEIKLKRHAGFPAPEDLPEWFPRNIKQIYLVNRHGGALSFKVSLVTQRDLLMVG